MSRILNRERRPGESTWDPANPDQSEEASKAFELVEPDSDRVTLVDVTAVNRTRNFHNFGLETPEFFDDLFLRLVNSETPRSRLRYRVRTPEIKERGFLAVMWPQLLAFLVFLGLSVAFPRWYF